MRFTKNMLTSMLTKLFVQAKELNLPRGNVISREELQEAIKDTIVKYNGIIFDVVSPI